MIEKFIATVKNSNRLVVGGMFFFNSPGHMLAEADHILRRIIADPSVRERSPIVLLPPTPLTMVIAELLKHHGVTVVMDPKAETIARQIQFFYPELILDVGVAHFKLTTLPHARSAITTSSQLELAWALRRDELTEQWIRLCKLWNATSGRYPLREALDKLPCDPEFKEIITGRKYAVLQIKTAIVNGTVRLLPPQHFYPTLEMLNDEGFSVIFAGRESMPEEFHRYGVFNYANSKFASPLNDFFVFKYAQIGIASPSGAGYFCDALDVPLCQYAPWTLQPHPGRQTIMVPSRLRKHTSPQILTFTQQIGAFLENYDDVKGPGAWHPNILDDIPPSAEDIRAGVAELLDKSIRSSGIARQHDATIRSLGKGGVWEVAGSTVASSFLTAHPEYLS
jgi:putative glycosyltransferase (TIGR04372 family)